MKLSSQNSACSSSDRPLGLRCRNDLEISRSAGRRVIVSDRIASTHHELTQEEASLFFALSHLSDKTISLSDLKEHYEQEFAPRRISFEELSSHLGNLHQAGLLVTEQEGQGEILWQRREQRIQTQRRWAWAQLLSIRLPGFNPQFLLDSMAWVARMAFSPVGAIFAVVMWVMALLVLLSSTSRLMAELPGLAELSSPAWVVSLLLCVAVLKSLHELGHAMACHRYGAEVREMGVMLLMFMPCLYCDVTDAWRLSSRWQRLVITSAGVLVELTLAAIAIFAWRLSEPGLIHSMALQIVVIASVATLVVNLNPLMRYDGYYLLSDLTETPNLWTRSRQAVTDLATRWFVKQNSRSKEQQQTSREPLWIALYGLLSQLFLFGILIAFAWLLMALAKVMRAEVLGWGLIGFIALGMVLPLVTRSIAWFKRPRYEQPLRRIRTTVFTIGFASLIYFVMMLEVPNRISAPAVIVPAESTVVAATLAGRLEQTIPLGTQVNKGDMIARLRSPELTRQKLAIETELATCKLELELIEAQRTTQPELAAQIPTAKSRIESCQERLKEMRLEMERLTLRASRSGIVMPAPKRSNDKNPSIELPLWSGELMSHAPSNANLGAWVEVGDIVAMIVDPAAWEVELQVLDADSERLAPGQPVRIALWQQASGLLQGEVAEIGRQSLPRDEEASQSASVMAEWLPATKETVRKVRVQLKEDASQPLSANFVAGGLGEARIDAGSQSIGTQLAHFIYATFRLPF